MTNMVFLIICVPVVDLVCLINLLQGMVKILEEVAKELKLVKVDHRFAQLFGGGKRC